MGAASIKAMGWAQSFPVKSGVKAGRRWARGHLEGMGWTELAPETVDDVLLTVSELITNAHVHAHSDAQVVLTWDRVCLHVSVTDASTEVPAPRAADPDSVSGRGMAIVDALADSWETHAQAGGKTISACFRPPGQRDPHAES